VLRIGTRQSALALQQTDRVIQDIRDSFPEMLLEIVKIVTLGDRDQRSSISEIGGKGAFFKELEVALCEGQIDVAVHSLKDITVAMHPDLELLVFLKPESISDALVSRNKERLAALPDKARIGTGSLRRKALLLLSRPDLQVIDIRGNVDSRVRKMVSENLDGIVLSEAGLRRLNLQHLISESFSPDTFIPAPGQGVIVVQIRKGDAATSAIVSGLSDPEQARKSRVELSLTKALGLGCQWPLGTYTTINEGKMRLKVFLAQRDLSMQIREEWSGDAETAEAEMPRFAERLLKALASE